MPRKVCHGCGAIKPATRAHFHRRTDSYDGLETTCRTCRCTKSNAWKRRRNYVTPPKPTGLPCLACGSARSGNVCLNCGIGYLRRTRAT